MKKLYVEKTLCDLSKEVEEVSSYDPNLIANISQIKFFRFFTAQNLEDENKFYDCTIHCGRRISFKEATEIYGNNEKYKIFLGNVERNNLSICQYKDNTLGIIENEDITYSEAIEKYQEHINNLENLERTLLIKFTK